MSVLRRAVYAACVAIASMSWLAPTAHATINEDEVLVVYNSASADAVTLLGVYLAAHPAIPAANILDLNDASLLVANMTQTDFVTKIRTPIRSYLQAAGAPQPDDIIAFALLRPFPHRIQDTDNPGVGDIPSQAGDELGAGDATYASVDAELALLWQNLSAGETGGSMDSLSDNLIDNPYHMDTTAIDTFPRSAIDDPKSFTNVFSGFLTPAWFTNGSGNTELTPGDIYLVCRIDGNTLSDAQAVIIRANDNRVDRRTVRILLDEFDLTVRPDLDDDPFFDPEVIPNDPFLAGDDYEETRDLLQAAGWDVRYDDTFDFISGTEETTPLIAYASYGENHDIGGAGENPPGSGTYIDDFTFSAGALFNTYESYNGRALNGLGTLFGQEQAADFFAAGGTFAVGQVYEPFTFSIPDNEFLFVNMLMHGRTFAEAAYSAMPALSWQQVALGDPLGRIHLLGDIDGDGDVDVGDVAPFADCLAGPEVLTPPIGCSLAEFARADLDEDSDVDLTDDALLQCLAVP